MIISCPNCDTAYNLSENAITSEGRKIRCKRCRHVFWARRLPSPAGSEPKIEIYYKDQEEAKKPAEQAPQTPAKSTGSPSRSATPTAPKLGAKLGVPKPFGAKPSLLKPPGTTNASAGTSDSKETKEVERVAGKVPRPGQPEPSESSTQSAGQPKKLSSLFGSSLKSKVSAPRFGTGAPLAKTEGANETSFGMPAISDKEKEGPLTEDPDHIENPSESEFVEEAVSDFLQNEDAPRATSLGIPSLKDNLAPQKSSRRRQSTLWMLSEDEIDPNGDAQLSENLEKTRNSVAEKMGGKADAPSEADFSDILDAQNDARDESPDPSNQTSPLLNFDRENLRKSFGGSPLAKQLAQNLAAKKPWPEAKDQTTNFDRDEESGRRNTTLFGLAAPISSNTTRYGEEDAAELFSNDADLDDFFNLDDVPAHQDAPELDAPVDYDKHPSNAESVVSVAYTEPLKPSEKDTARRLAKFLGRMTAAKKEGEDLLDPALQTVEKTADITRDVSRDEAVVATTREDRPPFSTGPLDSNFGGEAAPDLPAEDPILADLSAPMSPLHGQPPGLSASQQGGLNALGQPPTGRPMGPPHMRPPQHSLQGQAFGAPGAPPAPSYDNSFNFDQQRPPAHFQQHTVQNNAWSSGQRPPANFSPTVNNGPLFDQIESTDIISRESSDQQNASKPQIGNILLWGGVIAVVVLVGLLVAWFIVMKLL